MRCHDPDTLESLEGPQVSCLPLRGNQLRSWPKASRVRKPLGPRQERHGPGVPGLGSRTAPPPSGRDLVKQPLEILLRSDPSSVLPSNTLPVPAAPVNQRLSSQILEMRAIRVPHRAVLHEA